MKFHQEGREDEDCEDGVLKQPISNKYLDLTEYFPLLSHFQNLISSKFRRPNGISRILSASNEGKIARTKSTSQKPEEDIKSFTNTKVEFEVVKELRPVANLGIQLSEKSLIICPLPTRHIKPFLTRSLLHKSISKYKKD